jgi:hypothetical protein
MAVTEGITRAELDARFATAEAKAETARVGLEGKIDRVLDAISGLKEHVGDQVERLNQKLEDEVEQVRDDNKTTRTVTLVTIIISVIAAVAAIYAAQANNIAAMEVGLAAHTSPAAPIEPPVGGKK